MEVKLDAVHEGDDAVTTSHPTRPSTGSKMPQHEELWQLRCNGSYCRPVANESLRRHSSVNGVCLDHSIVRPDDASLGVCSLFA